MTGTRRSKLVPGIDRFSGLYLWAAFIVIFGVWTPSLFLTTATIHTIASSQAVAAMVAVAVLVPLAAGHYDLSVGATANLAGITAVVLQDSYSVNPVWAFAAGLGIGVLVGVVNSVIVVWLRVSSFIATLGMGSVLAAMLVIVTSNAQPNPPKSTAWSSFTQHSVFGFQVIVLYLLIIAVLVWWLLDKTPAGRYIYALGGNPEAARLSGVRVDKWGAISLICSSTISGLAGILFVSQSGPALTFGGTLLLPAFAAAFLGSTQLQPGRFNVWGTLIAIYVLATGVQGLELVSGAQWLNDMFNGVALILAVAMAVQRTPGARWRRRRARPGHGDLPAPTASPKPDPPSGVQQTPNASALFEAQTH